MNNFFWLVGACFSIVGGASLLGIALSTLLELVCECYISASRKFRGILKAEKIICEYRDRQKDFQRYLKERGNNE